jgi:hypothetical protein
MPQYQDFGSGREKRRKNSPPGHYCPPTIASFRCLRPDRAPFCDTASTTLKTKDPGDRDAILTGNFPDGRRAIEYSKR